MANDTAIPKALSDQLILDEIFDLTLYTKLRDRTTGKLRALLDELVIVETAHVSFWQKFLKSNISKLDRGRSAKLWILLLLHRVFGEYSVHIILESIEVYGIKKYLEVWERYEGTPLAASARQILDDELHHEDAILAASHERKISGEKIRNTFLGFNDGLVEILGSVSGFFAAFEFASSVLAAGLTVAVAGSISMAAGVYVSSGSEKEVQETERRRQSFLGQKSLRNNGEESALAGAVRVGIFYFFGSLVPLAPVLFGATTPLPSILVSAGMIILISLVLSFLSGMDIRRRITINLVVIFFAVVVSSAIGYIARVWLGLAI